MRQNFIRNNKFYYFYRNTFEEMTFTEIIQTKIFTDLQLFIPILNRWKHAGESVVFTNGCFDLVHRGHIDSLSKAADLGDRLVVGLNSDVSVKLLKGENRPLIDQQSRALLLGSLLLVDAEEIAGVDGVLAAGGKVERIELTEGFSTTDLIERIIKGNSH